jgi:hypothetical protein
VIIVAAVALVALSVVLLGGSLARLSNLRFRVPATILGALLLQIVIISVIPRLLPSWLAQALHLVSYGLALVFLVANRRIPGLWLIGAGGMSNLIAIGANKGIMPASPVALAAAGRAVSKKGFQNSAALASAHLRFLGDIFSTPRNWPLANVFSVGDILLVLGAFLLLHRVCRSKLTRLGWPGWYRAGLHPPLAHPPLAPAVLLTSPVPAAV